ncbi:hypothetical protein HKX48_002788 [Thoreauomyces humboldtii]|nr:hypothetical protein HKX48_002788 [Thoreauomyces humboldtii]
MTSEKDLEMIDYGSITIWVDRTDPLACISCQFRLGTKFLNRVLHPPLALIFGYPQTKVHVFWEEKETIAFNASGTLYFNMTYYQALHCHPGKRENRHEPNKPSEPALYWWFVVFAHEFAHNSAKGHGKEHGQAEEISSKSTSGA